MTRGMMVPLPAGGPSGIITGSGRLVTATIGAGRTLVKVGGAILTGIGLVSLSEEADEPNGEPEREDRRDLGRPGTRRNKVGSPKTPQEQFEQIEQGARSGKVFAETIGKSEQLLDNELRDLRGRSATEVLREKEKQK